MSQAAVIFLVAFFILDMLKNKDMLADFVIRKLNATIFSELGLAIFAVTFVLGLLYIGFVRKVSMQATIYASHAYHGAKATGQLLQ